MLKPATRVASIRVMVGPMHDTALVVPDILAFKGNLITGLQSVDAGCKIDVMGNEHGMAITGIDQEALMPAALIVIRKNLHNTAFGLDRYILKTLRVSRGDAAGTAFVERADLGLLCAGRSIG
jgi:hypothetical protein